MDMLTYLSEIEYAATESINLMWKEVEEVARLESELKPLAQATQRDYRQAEAIAMMNDDDDGISTLLHWETYFGVDKNRHHKEEEVQAVAERVATHQKSVALIAGSLLQYAKQGLSQVYGSPQHWPAWAAIGTQGFGNIILQSRNQTMHWDTPPLTQRVQDCFTKMATEVDPVFNQFHARSLAFEVVSELKWKNFAKFRADMLRV
jgi:hypothetical protein